MFYLWWAPDHVARFDFLNRASPFPSSANAGGNEQVLPCRVNVPSGSGPRLEGDIGTGKVRRILCREQRVNADIAGKIFGRPFGGRLRAGPRYGLRLFACFRGQYLAGNSACEARRKSNKTVPASSFIFVLHLTRWVLSRISNIGAMCACDGSSLLP